MPKLLFELDARAAKPEYQALVRLTDLLRASLGSLDGAARRFESSMMSQSRAVKADAASLQEALRDSKSFNTALREEYAAARQGADALGRLAKARAEEAHFAAMGADAATKEGFALRNELKEAQRLTAEIEKLNASRARQAHAAPILSGAREPADKERQRAAAARMSDSALAGLNARLEVRNALLRSGLQAGSAEAREFESLTRAAQKYRQETDRVTAAKQKLQAQTSSLRNAFTGLRSTLATIGLGLLVSQSVDAALALNRAERGLYAVTGTAEGAGREMAFVRKESERLGLALASSAQDFARISAAAKNTSLEGAGVRDIFSAVAETGTVMSLSADEMKGALNALAQMIGKGTVQAEELRGQLGDRIPGAVPIMARALGVGTAELQKMLEKGEVLANEALPKFAAELRKTFGAGLTTAVSSFQAQLNRLKNDIFLLRAEFGRGFLEGFLAGLGELRGAMTDAELRAAARELGETLGAALRDAASVAAFLAKNLDLVKAVVVTVVGLKLAAWAFGVAAAFNEAGGMAAFFNKTLLANPYFAAAAGLIALGAALDGIIDSWAKASQKQIDYYGSTNQAAKAIMDLAAAVRDAQAVIDDTLLRGASNARVMFEGVLADQERQLALLEKQRDSWRMKFAGGLGNAALARDIDAAKEKIADARGQLQLLDKVGAQLTDRVLNFNDAVTVTATALNGVSEGANKAAEAAAKLRKEIESDLAALRTPAQQLADDIGLWVARLEAGVLRAGEFAAAMAGLARQNPLSEVAEDRDPASEPGVSGVDLRIWDAHLEQLDRARQITLAMRTEEEKRADAVAEARALYAEFVATQGKAGIDAETLRRVLKENADILEEMEFGARSLGQGLLSAVDAISGSIDMLADRFGGIFEELQKIIGALQQARSMYNSWSQAATDMGASASTSAAAGAFGAYVALAVAAYDAFQGHIAGRRARQYDIGGSFSYDQQGFDFSSNTSAAARDLARQIASTAEAFAEAIGGVIDTFAAVEVQIRQDGKYFKAFVAGELIGKFESLDEAIQAAIAAAFADPQTTLRGLSALVEQGMRDLFEGVEFQAGMLGSEEIQEFLVSLREIAELNWTQGARAAQETIRHLDELTAALMRMSEMTPAVQQGLDDIVAAEARAWESWRRSIEGGELSAADRLRLQQQEGELYNAQRELRLAELRFREQELLAQAAAVEARRQIAIRGAGIEGEAIDVGRANVNAKAALLEAEARMSGVSAALIQAQIDAIRRIIGVLEAQGPIDIGNIRLPGAGGGRRQQRTDFEDELRGIADEGLSPLARQFKETREEIERVTAEAARLGADAELTAAALGELNRQLAESVRSMIDGTRAGSEWEQRAQEIRERWDEVAAAVQAHLDATGEQLVEFWEIAEAMAREVTALFEERIDGLSLPLETTRDEMADLAAMLNDLYAAMAGGYIDAARYVDILGQIRTEMFLGLGDSLMGFLERYYGEVEGFEDFRRHLEQVRFELELANMQLQFALLQGMGALTEAQIAMIQGVFDFIAANPVDWDAFFGGFDRPANQNFGGQGADGGTDDIMRDKAAFADRLRDILELDLDPLERQWRQLQREIADLMAEGQRLGFSNAELMAAQQALIRDFWRGVTDPIREFYDELNLSDLSPLTDAQRFAEAQREAFATVAAAAHGDLQSVADLPQVLRDYLESAGANFGTAGGGYQEIFRWVQQVLHQFSNYAGGQVTPPTLPGTSNVVPFPRQGQVPLPAAVAGAQAAADNRRMLEATLEQNEILRQLLASEQARLAEERRSNRQGRTGTNG